MSHIGFPIVIVKAQNETPDSDLNHLGDSCEDDTEIKIGGPVNLDQLEQPVKVQFKEWPPIWTAEEDTLLNRYIVEKGKRWPEIAFSINRDLHNSVNIRSSSSCKERWRNNHKPTLNSN